MRLTESDLYTLEQNGATYGDVLALAAEVRASWAERDALRASLETIRREYGQVCPEYELCTHRACESSYGAWATADEVLARQPGAPAPEEA